MSKSTLSVDDREDDLFHKHLRIVLSIWILLRFLSSKFSAKIITSPEETKNEDETDTEENKRIKFDESFGRHR